MGRNSYNRKYSASPTFQILNPSDIAVSSKFYVNFENDKPASRKYLPFDFAMITNRSSVPIKVYLNQTTNIKIVQPSSFLVFDKNSLPAFHSCIIENMSSTTVISSGDIEVIGQRVAYDNNDFISSMHKVIVGALYG